MPAHFTQQPHDPEHQPEVRPRFPLGAMLWIPLSIVLAAGVVAAAKFGHEKALGELARLPNPAAGNETLSEPFVFDPGEDPIVFADGQQALRDHLSSPPGSRGSGTLVISDPMRLRIVTRDGEFARVLVIEGQFEGQRFWTRSERLLEAKRSSRDAPMQEMQGAPKAEPADDGAEPADDGAEAAPPTARTSE